MVLLGMNKTETERVVLQTMKKLMGLMERTDNDNHGNDSVSLSRNALDGMAAFHDARNK